MVQYRYRYRYHPTLRYCPRCETHLVQFIDQLVKVTLHSQPPERP